MFGKNALSNDFKSFVSVFYFSEPSKSFVVRFLSERHHCSQKISVVLINFVCTQKLCPSLTIQTILYCKCYEPNISTVPLKSSISDYTGCPTKHDNIKDDLKVVFDI